MPKDEICPSHNGSKKRDYPCEARQKGPKDKEKHRKRSKIYRKEMKNGATVGDGKDNHSPSGHRDGKTVSVAASDNKNYWDEERSDKEDIKRKISESIKANKRKTMRKA